jgi:predicted dehydrogenase/threonine dehydrogenase-like Zn-dependent dehydrogenase
MKQVLQNLRNGDTVIAEVPVPSPYPGTALVRTAASLVSVGTERMLVEFAEKSLLSKARSRPDLVRQVLDKARREGLWTTLEAGFNRLDQPMPLGYSSSGTIISIGEGLQGFKAGQRVACSGGGYAVHAEYALIPQNLLTYIPDQVDFESAAFTTLGAIALHGFRLAEVQVGEHLAIIGLGLLGLLTMQIARAAGCQTLGIDLDPKRVKLAKEMGFHAVQREHAVEAGKNFSHDLGCDAVLICADSPTTDPVELGAILARDRARLIAIGAVGLNLPRKIFFEKELSLINSRSYGPGRYDPIYEEAGIDYPIGYVRWTEGRNFKAFVDLLATGQVDIHPMITHRYPIEQAQQAYRLITGKLSEPFLGVLLTYPYADKINLQVTNGIKVSGKQSSVSPRTAPICRLGVLGAGNFATTVLLPALRKIPDIELVGITSASGVRAQHALKRFGFQYATGQESTILDDSQINTIAVLTPHHLHSQQVILAIEKGKHVFCEKPLAINSDQLIEIASALGKHGSRLLMVGFNRRFAPLSQRLHQFIYPRSEPIIAHYRVNAGYLPLNHWLHNPQIGGGRIIGEGCHFIDYLTFLVGHPPVSVTALSMPDLGRYREDNVVLNYSFSDGSIGVLTYLANGDRRFPKERVEVFTGGKVAVLDDFRSLEIISKGQRTVLRSRFRQDKGHYAEWVAFNKAILADNPPPIPYNDLLAVTQATFSTLQSIRNNEMVAITPPKIEVSNDG